MSDYYRGNGNGYGLLGGLGQGMQDIGGMMMMNSMESAKENKRANMDRLKSESAERWKQKEFDQRNKIAEQNATATAEQTTYDRNQDTLNRKHKASEGLLERDATAEQNKLDRSADVKKQGLDRTQEVLIQGMEEGQKPEYKPGQALEKIANVDKAIGNLQKGERMTDDLYGEMVRLDPMIASLLNNNKAMQPEDRQRAVASLVEFRKYLEGFKPQQQSSSQAAPQVTPQVAPQTNRRPINSFGK